MVLGHHGPAIRQQPHVGLAAVDHRFDGEGHAFSQFKTRASATVVQNLRIFVEDATDAVSAVFADDRTAACFGVLLDCCADIAEAGAGPDHGSEAPRGGNECVRTGYTRWSPPTQ